MAQEPLGFALASLEEVKIGSDHYQTKRQFITCGSTGLTDTQKRYSTVELEALAIFCACSKSNYYLQCAPQVDVYSDNCVVCDIFKMQLSKIKNKRLQLIMEKLRPYNIVCLHVKGETNFLSDRLSRHLSDSKDCPEFEGHNISICNKSCRLLESSVGIKDPMLAVMAEKAKMDSD